MNTPKDIDLSTSVAGEEDPGAAIDLSIVPKTPLAPMSPGDEAPAGASGTGEKVCPACGGSGKLGGRSCPECEGTGKITAAIGGA